MGSVKLGILGSGFVVSYFHLPSLREIPGVEVVAIGSRRQATVEELAKRFGVKKSYHGDNYLEGLCRDPEIDSVLICLPNFLHLEATVHAAENGKNVICEKPLGRNADEAEKMLRAVERHKVLHGYAENQVFAPQITRVKEMIDNGSLGRVFWVRTREAHFGPHSDWFWNPELSGGGSLLDMGCHSVEVARYFIRDEPVEVMGWGATLVHGSRTRAEDNSLAFVRYRGGQVGQSENSWAAHGGLDLRYEVYGSEGAAFIDVTRETGVRVFTVAPEERVGYVVEKAEVARGWMYPIWREHELYGYLHELQHFIQAFSEGRMPRETYRDGYIVNKILDAAYRSMKSGRWEGIQ
ncbi:scyllo-inositol 2-dehydrogenase (NAD(+)) [Candidatus Calditenuaceae archaeon HR02]|nr:scyllo-inositol 2-dehydrogenase (NAD(+)) [Candidatus Calditenuaceae archaeon HR02]